MPLDYHICPRAVGLPFEAARAFFESPRFFRRLYLSTFNCRLLTFIMGPVLAPFLISIFQFLFSSYVEEDGVRRRRGRRGREGGPPVRRRSTGPRGRAGGENRPPAFLLSASCIRCNSKPGCGRNYTPTVPEARRDLGTGPWTWSGANSRSIGRARARGWPCAASCSAESLPPRC